jgi:DNA-binding transcriptional MerR regulator
MQSNTLTRREVAQELGLTYSTLRVYERHLGGLLQLSQGANRTTLYGCEAVELLGQAVELKRKGLPFSKLVQYFRGELTPEPTTEAPILEDIQSKTDQILSLSQRLEEKLRFVEELSRTLLGNLSPAIVKGEARA